MLIVSIMLWLDDDIVWLEEDPPPMVDALYLDASSLN